jgi:hypothetical protein
MEPRQGKMGEVRPFSSYRVDTSSTTVCCSIIKSYHQDLKRLQTTGEGVQPSNDAEEGTQAPEDDVHGAAESVPEHHFLDCYIPASGPDKNTSDAAKNLWSTSISLSIKLSANYKQRSSRRRHPGSPVFTNVSRQRQTLLPLPSPQELDPRGVLSRTTNLPAPAAPRISSRHDVPPLKLPARRTRPVTLLMLIWDAYLHRRVQLRRLRRHPKLHALRNHLSSTRQHSRPQSKRRNHRKNRSAA